MFADDGVNKLIKDLDKRRKAAGKKYKKPASGGFFFGM
jgi:hypothetical protein